MMSASCDFIQVSTLLSYLTIFYHAMRPTASNTTTWTQMQRLNAGASQPLHDHIETVQRYFTRRVYYRCKLDCSHDYLQRLKYLNLESLELRRIYNDLIMVYKIFHGLVNVNANELINVKTSTSTISTRGHRFKLQTSQFKRDVAKNQFCNRVVSNWNNLPDSIVATASIVHFKKALRTAHFEAALTFNRHY